MLATFVLNTSLTAILEFGKVRRDRLKKRRKQEGHLTSQEKRVATFPWKADGVYLA